MTPLESLYSYTAESSVVGSCMLDPEAPQKVAFIKPDDFFNSTMAQLYSSILEMTEQGKSIDMITLCEFIGDDELFTTITQTASNLPSSANVVAYADIVKDYSNKRKAVAVMQDSIDKLQNQGGNAVAVMADVGDFVNELAQSASVGNVLGIEDLINITCDKMDESNRGVKTGLSTGIPEIDNRLGYMRLAFGEITVFGGLSKNGKTLTANTVTARVELDDDEVGHIFTIEMTCDAMFNAVISAKTGVPANFYCRQDYYAERYPNEFDTLHGRWGDAAKNLYNSKKFTFDGQKEVDADYICTNMRKVAAQARNNGKKLRYVVIDHLHRMNFHNNNQPLTYAIRDAVRKIKNTASDLGVAVVMLAQLNNRAEGQDPTSFHILDSSSVRHELQAFIGVRMFRDKGSVYFGIYADSQRFGDQDTLHYPAYMKLINGVLRSLPSDEQYWSPPVEEKENDWKK